MPGIEHVRQQEAILARARALHPGWDTQEELLISWEKQYEIVAWVLARPALWAKAQATKPPRAPQRVRQRREEEKEVLQHALF